MAEYNPSKIIKDGNTYNFRDTTKIPLAGSNQISGDLIPSTDETVNLGSPSYQWNQAYIKSLTINGVECGDILTHNAAEFASKATTLSGYGITDAYTKTQVDNKISGLVNSAPETLDTLNELASALGNDPNFATTVANQIGTKANDSEVVKLSGNQTIAGIKSFSNDIRISKASPFCNVFSSGYIKGQAPTSNIYSGVRFFDDINSGSTNTITGGFEVEYNRDGYNKSYIASRNYAGENHKFFTVGLRVPNDDTRSVDFLPSVNGIVNLGTSTSKWAKVYSDDIVHTTSNETIDGVKTFTSNMVIQGSRKVTCNLDNSFIELDGGTTWGKGGSIVLSGQERSSYTNSVLIVSKSDTNTDILQYQNGELKPLSNNTNNSSLGTSTNQWASVYAQTYYYNGTEFLNKFVTTDTEQSISQVKEFTRTNSDTLRLKNGRVALGETISSDAYTQFVFRDKNTDNLAYIRDIYFTDGSTTLAFYARNKYANGAPSTTGSVSYAYLGIGVDATGKPSASVKGDFAPYSDATYNLGSSTSQWKNTYTSNILINNDINIASSLINKTSNSGVLTMRGGISDTEGASLSLYGKDYGGSPGLIGNIYMTAYGSSDYTNFRIYPNGIIRVYNNSTATTKNVAMQEDVIPRSGGAVITDYFLGRSVDTGSLMISGGTSWSSGGSLEAFGSNHSSYAGRVRLQPALSDANFKTMNLEPSGTWTWSGTACQITSDQRYKQQITEIDDKLLDAWEDVELVQFKYNESVDTKGKSARLHTGYVVQQIDSACKSHNVDISEYGLYCHEEYPEETKEVEVEQADGTKTKETKVIREASEHYSLRYTEALIVECKYLRRCIARLTARIEELEKGNNSK